MCSSPLILMDPRFCHSPVALPGGRRNNMWADIGRTLQECVGTPALPLSFLARCPVGFPPCVPPTDPEQHGHVTLDENFHSVSQNKYFPLSCFSWVF